MKRTKDKTEGKVHFQKVGRGSMRLKYGKLIKPNEKFWAFEWQVPRGSMDLLTRLDDSPPVQPLPEETPVVIEETEFTLETLAGGWFNILDADGKKINEKSLRKDDAEEHLKTLNEK